MSLKKENDGVDLSLTPVKLTLTRIFKKSLPFSDPKKYFLWQNKRRAWLYCNIKESKDCKYCTWI